MDDYFKELKKKKIFEDFLRDYRKYGFQPVPKKVVGMEDTPDGFTARQAVAWLKQVDLEESFILWVSFEGPHPPCRAVGDFGSMYKAEDMPMPLMNDDKQDIERTKRMYTQYYGRISQIDMHIGQIMDVLKKRRIYKNTVIVYTSDHGDMFGDRGIHDKRYFYEPSVTVPLIISGPGIPRGEICNALSENIDIAATLLSLAGIKANNLSGRDLIDLIERDPNELRSAAFSKMGTWLMIRTGNWKLTFDPEQGGVQDLYNMRTDPLEIKNLAGQPAFSQIEKQLLEQLLGWFVSSTTSTHDKEHRRIKRILVHSL